MNTQTKENRAKSNKKYQSSEKGKEKHNMAHKKWKDKKRQFVLNYKSSHPCVICGESRTACLDFHHVNNDKDGNISRMVIDGYSLDRIQKEIDKCIVVCANCHRIVHYNESE